MITVRFTTMEAKDLMEEFEMVSNLTPTFENHPTIKLFKNKLVSKIKEIERLEKQNGSKTV